ncbi:hypothetical protein E2C01_006629 [Portunus trituberculatus]|uniref:Uncharacterized protein n=1 Tax=Portunus trituberculatus TaxID=210409 RepID=A0A5B7CWV5_PORTR|nr:hypothetical protein [Portunus trituberculatus]
MVRKRECQSFISGVEKGGCSCRSTSVTRPLKTVLGGTVLSPQTHREGKTLACQAAGRAGPSDTPPPPHLPGEWWRRKGLRQRFPLAHYWPEWSGAGQAVGEWLRAAVVVWDAGQPLGVETCHAHCSDSSYW